MYLDKSLWKPKHTMVDVSQGCIRTLFAIYIQKDSIYKGHDIVSGEHIVASFLCCSEGCIRTFLQYILKKVQYIKDMNSV